MRTVLVMSCAEHWYWLSYRLLVCLTAWGHACVLPHFNSSSWRLPGSGVLELNKNTPKSNGSEGVVFVVQCILYAYTVYLVLCGQKSHLFLFCLWLWTILPLYAFRWLDSTDRPFWQYVHHSLSLTLVQYESVQLCWNQLICFTPELYLIVFFQLSCIYSDEIL